MATSNTKRARGPRKAIITPATLQRAQELISEHREAEAALARFMATGAQRPRVDVVLVDGSRYSILPHYLATSLAKDVLALEAEAKRLGVALKDPPPAPLLDVPAPGQAEAA